MDWIEQLVGISPDGGNGALEVMYLLGMISMVGVLGFRRLFRSNSR